jgi:iron complex outermembrane receptor protein
MKASKAGAGCWLGISVLALCPQAAYAAQVGGPTPAEVAEDAVGEIIVTAQKRSESVQQVPIAITAVGGDTLLRAGISGTDAIQKVAPGLNIATVGSGFVSYIYIRGGGTNQLDIGADPSVAYYVDEIYIGGTAGLQFDLFDIDHVEVLKGPQGTLFGRNAASGAISIVTKRPASVLEGYASLEAGNYGHVVARSGITGPLAGDSLFYRVAVGSKHHDAYVKDLNGVEDPGHLSSLSGRAQIEWRGIGARLLITGEGFRSRNGQTGQFFSTALKTSVLTPAASAAFPSPGEDFYHHYYRPGFENQDLWSLSGRLEADVSFGEFTAITAYRNNHFSRSQDYTPGADALRLDTDERARTFSQEVRIVSHADQRLRWLAGLYFYHASQSMIYDQIAGATFVVPPVRNTVRRDDARLVTDSYAAFGQVSYDVLDNLTLIAGLRYMLDKKRSTRTLSTMPATATSNFQVDRRDEWHAFTPALTVQYHATPEVMIYASYRRGFKSGGYQPAPVASRALGDTPFNPEHVDSYEVGLKSSFFGRRLTLNIDAFLSKIRDQQILQTVPDGTGVINVVSNAGSTTAKGVELSVKARPVAGFNVSADITYQQAQFDRYSTLVNSAPTDYSGNTQLRSPDVAAAIGADYDIDLEDAGKLTLGGQYSYRSKIFYTVANLTVPGLYQSGYGLADAHAIYEPNGGNWNLKAWVRNIGNTHYFRNIVVIGATGIAQPGDPTTFGGTFVIRF